ncbi:MAG: PH domain-containing protein [Propionibacteriaceae bacterium]|jgi:putative membrane protein|nr:PH domain-containing protein [Propionibacteriaceae bacterium]
MSEPLTNPPSAASEIAPGRHPMHPGYVILNGLQVGTSIIAIGLAFLVTSGGWAWLVQGASLSWIIPIAIGGLVAIIAVTSLVSWLYYQRYRWEITETDIHIYAGIIIKRQTHIPFQRVQAIEFRAGVVQRILGIVRLKIETAGGATNKAAIIPALKLAQAEILRAEVFRRKKGELSQGTPSSSASETEADRLVRQVGDKLGGLRGLYAEQYDETSEIEYEYGLSAKELVLSAISGDHNLVLLAVLFGGLTQLGAIAPLFNLDEPVEWIVKYAIANYAVPVLSAILITITIVSYLLGILGTAISYGGFKARRRGGRIEVEMGLLARQYQAVSVSRVQSVVIKQGAIRRLLGYAEIRLQTIDALDTNQQGGQPRRSGVLLHPFVKLARVAEILSQMVPDYEERCGEAELRSLPKVARRRVFIRHVGFFVGFYAGLATALTIGVNQIPTEYQISALSWLVAAVWILLALLTIGRSVAAALWYRQAAYAYNSKMLTIRQGYFGLTTTIIGKRRIQWGGINQNPFQRRAGVASIQATTAAGVVNTTTTLRDLSHAEALAYLDWLRP